jgi:hypothetical protein
LLADFLTALYAAADPAAAAGDPAAAAAVVVLLLLHAKTCTGISTGCHAARCCCVSQLAMKALLSCRLCRLLSPVPRCWMNKVWCVKANGQAGAC